MRGWRSGQLKSLLVHLYVIYIVGSCTSFYLNLESNGNKLKKKLLFVTKQLAKLIFDAMSHFHPAFYILIFLIFIPVNQSINKVSMASA